MIIKEVKPQKMALYPKVGYKLPDVAPGVVETEAHTFFENLKRKYPKVIADVDFFTVSAPSFSKLVKAFVLGNEAIGMPKTISISVPIPCTPEQILQLDIASGFGVGSLQLEFEQQIVELLDRELGLPSWANVELRTKASTAHEFGHFVHPLTDEELILNQQIFEILQKKQEKLYSLSNLSQCDFENALANPEYSTVKQLYDQEITKGRTPDKIYESRVELLTKLALQEKLLATYAHVEMSYEQRANSFARNGMEPYIDAARKEACLKSYTSEGIKSLA